MKSSIFAILLAALLALAGCADDENHAAGGVAAPTETGSISFTVQWPKPAGSQPMTIPASTEWIRVRVKQSDGGYTGFADLLPPIPPAVTSSATIANVPIGTYTAEALAMQSGTSPVLLAYGMTASSFSVQSGQTANAPIVMAAASAVFSQLASPVTYGSTPTLELTFTSWPLELRQLAIPMKYYIGDYPLSVSGEGVVACTIPSTTADETARNCVSVALPNFGTTIEFVGAIDASAWARVFGAEAPTLYPESRGIPNARWFEIQSGPLSFQSPFGSISITVS